MSRIDLTQSDEVIKRLTLCQQDIDTFFTNTTHDIQIDFREFCDYLSIDATKHIRIETLFSGLRMRSDIEEQTKSNSDGNQSPKTNSDDSIPSPAPSAVKFMICTDINEGIFRFLAIIFRLLDKNSRISLFVGHRSIDEQQLVLIENFQSEHAEQLLAIQFHSIAGESDHSKPFLGLFGWATLKIVSLQNNHITDVDVDKICSLISDTTDHGNQLAALILDFNCISDQGFQKMMECIVNCLPSLYAMSLQYNQITDISVDYIQSCLQENPSFLNNMRQLKLSHNRITEERKTEFRKFLCDREDVISCQILCL